MSMLMSAQLSKMCVKNKPNFEQQKKKKKNWSSYFAGMGWHDRSKAIFTKAWLQG